MNWGTLLSRGIVFCGRFQSSTRLPLDCRRVHKVILAGGLSLMAAWQFNATAQLSSSSDAGAGRLPLLPLATDIAPVVTNQPVGQTAKVGQMIGFKVAATGTAPLAYQWSKDGSIVPGATNAVFNLGAALTNHAGSYTVVVSNAAGSVTSAPPAVVTVNPVPPGRVIAWGRAADGATNVPAGLNAVIAVSANGEHTLALSQNGTVAAWGLNSQGQTVVPPGLSEVAAVAAGYFHSLALTSNGTVVAWGANDRGQTTIPGGLTNVRSLAAGFHHTLALKHDGTVVAWGFGDFGQAIVPVAAQSGVVAVAAGTHHSVALKADGTVVAWGYGANGETNVPPGLADVIEIACGYNHVLARKHDGSVVGWGFNSHGQTIAPMGLGPVKALTAGYIHSMALKQDGTVATWGGNNEGQLNVPPAVVGAVAITAGGVHNAVIVSPLPDITAQPMGQSFGPEGSITLGVTATGMGLTYQWQFNGTNLPGATGPGLTLTNLTTANAGVYRVLVGNSDGGIVTSQPATLLFFGDLRHYAGTILAGPVGQQFRVDYADVVAPGTTNWQVLTNLALPSSPYLFIDPNSPGKAQRFYRAAPLP